MKYLLDTNVCIKILNGNNSPVLSRIENIPLEDVGISSVVAYELFYGAYKSQRVNENVQRIKSFTNNIKILPFSFKESNIAGQIRAYLEKIGTQIGPNDLLIGATAFENDLILVTHNTKEFSRIENLKYEDWEV